MAEIWPMIHEARRALATDLASLRAEQWDTPSLCAAWSVRDVLAHMTATASITPAAFFPKLLASGFSLKKLQDKAVSAARTRSTAEGLAAFEAIVTATKHPPGPTPSWLGETLVHAADIRRPLGIAHDTPVEATRVVADFYKGSNLVIGAKKRIDGVTLRATDTDWSHGQGPEVAGPLLSLVLAMSGRQVALADCTGDGVDVVRSRP